MRVNRFFKNIFFTASFVLLMLFAWAQQSVAQHHPIEGTVLINAFKQNKNANNCAAIALIKASIGTFGLNGVIATKGQTDSTFICTLRNGKSFTINSRELQYSSAKSKFVQKANDSASIQIKLLADTLFTVMCKQLQQKDSTTFEAAVWRLNYGYKTSEIASLLGLQFKPVAAPSSKKLSGYRHIVIYNYYHAAYSTNGLYDFAENSTGQAAIKDFRWNHIQADHIYDPFFCDIKEGLLVVDQ